MCTAEPTWPIQSLGDMRGIRCSKSVLAVEEVSRRGLPREKVRFAPKSDTGEHALVSGHLRTCEGRHHLLGEQAQLLLELRRRQSLGPVDHEGLEPWILGFDRPDAVDDLAGRPAEPRLLLDALADRGDRGRRARGAPGAALLVGVAHETERREPLVALVM